MTRAWIGSDQSSQSELAVVVKVRDLLPPGHAAFDFQALVGQLDLSEFEAVYRADGRGRPPFAPRLMVTLILYCRSKGLMTGRAVEAACWDDLGARMITGNRRVQRSTVDRFIKIHARALKGLLAQTIRLGHAQGLVDVSVVAGDGTYVLANAAMGATVDEAGLLLQIADLQQQIAAAQATWLEQVGAHDTEQPALYGDTDTSPLARPATSSGKDTRALRRVGALIGMLHSRQAALTHLRTHPNTAVLDWSDKLQKDQDRVHRNTLRLDACRADAQAKLDHRHATAAAGIKPTGPKPGSVDEYSRVQQAKLALDTANARAAATAASRPTTTRVNTTDPASGIMPGKHDGYDQRHNIQALACKKQFVLAIGTHDSSNDKRALINLLRAGRANLDAAGITDPIEAALFDNGYASEANFTADLPVKFLLVAVEKEARQTLRLRDGITTAAQTWQDMANRLDQPDNRALYKRRGAIIEPLFAQLFARFGRNINFRGDNVDTELHLWAVTHNLLKISRHRPKTRPPT